MGAEPIDNDHSAVDAIHGETQQQMKRNRQAWILLSCSIVVLVVPWLWVLGPMVVAFGVVLLRRSRTGLPVRRLPLWVAVAIGSALCLLLAVGMVAVLWQGLFGGGLRGA
jgi:hypothetical protein